MSKKVFYAVYVFNDERGGRECVAYCRTKEIAKRELKKYRDFYCSKPPKPDGTHICKCEMIIE